MSVEMKEQKGVSRRYFLKRPAVVAAAAGGFIPNTGIVGAATPLSTDICIIGVAGSGLIAAVS